MEYTLSGSFTLPSLGKVYGRSVNPNVTLRSMTVAEEMKRLNSSDRPYKVLADIIDDCLVEKPGISAYDMCLGDFQFLLHKLRAVTYGNKYELSSKCPYCGFEVTGTIDLSEMEVSIYNSDVERLFNIELPVSKKKVTLLMQTPRILDDISMKVKEQTSRTKSKSKDSAFLYNIESIINTVDGVHLDHIEKPEFIRSLCMADVNYIIAAMTKANDSIGLNLGLDFTCDLCGTDFTSPFRITPEFFRPTVNI